MEETVQISEDEMFKKLFKQVREKTSIDDMEDFIKESDNKEVKLLTLYDWRLKKVLDAHLDLVDEKLDERFNEMNKRFDKLEELLKK